MSKITITPKSLEPIMPVGHRWLKNWKRPLLSLALGAVLVWAFAVAMPVSLAAATPATVAAPPIIVDGTSCLLSDAILSANTDTAVNGCAPGNGADTIELQVDVNLSLSSPVVTSAITLNGNGHQINGQGIAGVTVLRIGNSGHLTATQITIMGGNALTVAGGIDNNGGTVVLNYSRVTSNTGSAKGGALAITPEI